MSINLNTHTFQSIAPTTITQNSHQDQTHNDQLWQKYGRDMEPYTANEQKLLSSGRFNRRTLEADFPDETALKQKMARNQLRGELGISSKQHPFSQFPNGGVAPTTDNPRTILKPLPFLTS